MPAASHFIVASTVTSVAAGRDWHVSMDTAGAAAHDAAAHNISFLWALFFSGLFLVVFLGTVVLLTRPMAQYIRAVYQQQAKDDFVDWHTRRSQQVGDEEWLPNTPHAPAASTLHWPMQQHQQHQQHQQREQALPSASPTLRYWAKRARAYLEGDISAPPMGTQSHPPNPHAQHYVPKPAPFSF